MILALALALALQDIGAPGAPTAPPPPETARESDCAQAHGAQDGVAVMACDGPADPGLAPLEELEAAIVMAHPAQMLQLAARLSDEGNRLDDALFWFYAGQLRWRIELACDPPEPGGEGVVLGAMMGTLGPMINRYAASDVDNWLAMIARVLEWDARTPDPFMDQNQARCAAARSEQRSGLANLAEQIEEQREALEHTNAPDRREPGPER